MNGPDSPREIDSVDFAPIYASTPIPAWAGTLKIRREAGGRPVLSGEIDGCWVWVQPKAWSKMTLRESSGAPNYGVQIGGMQVHAGQIETNDPSFGREMLGARSGSEVPMPDPSQAQGPASANSSFYGASAVIFAVGMVLAAFVAALKRRASV